MSRQSVDELREQLAEAERKSDDFLSLVTHELKTPLTPLKALAQLIRSRVRRARAAGESPDLDALERNLITIERQVDRMAALVNDLLEVSRAQKGTFALQPEPVDLVQIARDVVDRYVALTAEDGRHRVTLDAPETLPAFADRARLELALWNLVGNAVKFSPRGGEVAVRLSEREGGALIEVRDEGIGIAAADLGRLGREPFTRGTTKGTFSGLGTGLYLARLIAEGHGGSLELHSDGEDRGTVALLLMSRAGTPGA